MNKYNKLQQFRFDTYQMLVKARDATFELMDSIMTSKNADSLADFSLSPLFGRKWHSTYEAIQDSRPNANKMMKRYIQEIPEMQCLLFSHKKYKNKKRGIKTPPIKHYFELKNSVHSSLFSIQGRISFKSIYLSVALRNSLAIIPSVETTVI